MMQRDGSDSFVDSSWAPQIYIYIFFIAAEGDEFHRPEWGTKGSPNCFLLPPPKAVVSKMGAEGAAPPEAKPDIQVAVCETLGAESVDL